MSRCFRCPHIVFILPSEFFLSWVFSVSSEERVIALEREVIDTRKAAVALIVGWLDETLATPSARRNAAQWFDGSAVDADVVAARVARLVAAALRGN
jgi:hypothetical protein